MNVSVQEQQELAVLGIVVIYGEQNCECCGRYDGIILGVVILWCDDLKLLLVVMRIRHEGGMADDVCIITAVNQIATRIRNQKILACEKRENEHGTPNILIITYPIDKDGAKNNNDNDGAL